MKQAILVRQDLKMDKGKLAVQVAHASVESVLNSSKSKVEKWREQGMKKIVCKVENLQDLKQYMQKAKSEKLRTALIKDAGKTFFKRATITCLAIGPDTEEKIDRITSKLKLL